MIVPVGKPGKDQNPPRVRIVFIEENTYRVAACIELTDESLGRLFAGRPAKGNLLVEDLRELHYNKMSVVEVAIPSVSGHKAKEKCIERWRKRGWNLREEDLNNPYRFVRYGDNFKEFYSIRATRTKTGKNKLPNKKK